MTDRPHSLLDRPEVEPVNMNPLLDALRTTRFTGGIFLDCEFTAPWCVSGDPVGPNEVGLLMMPLPAHVIAYHYVTAGRALLELEDCQPVCVDAGEIIVIPANENYKIGSDLRRKAVSAKDLVQSPAGGRMARIVYGGGGQRTQIYCGFLGADAPNTPLISYLPRLLKLEIREGASAAWIESSLRLAAWEIASGSAGSPAILAPLAEGLFVEAVRRYVDSQPEVERGWLAGLRDPVVGRALGLLHARKDHRWTLGELAAKSGISRSALVERFVRVMGEPPMRYLAKQRLQLAAQRLRTSHEAVARIALEAGYESEAAFNRAFKRELGVPPAIWRRQATDGSTSSTH
jgi:AraC-like DNA-binding protein